MDVEGLGRKLLLTPSGDLPQNPWRADGGYCESISQNANPASTFELSQCRHCKAGTAWAEEWLLGALRQSVPQNVHVHLLGLDREYINIFLAALVGQSSQGRTPTRPRDKKTIFLLWNYTEKKGPVCPRTGPILSQGGLSMTVPVCPGHRPAQNVYVYWFFLPDWKVRVILLAPAILSAPKLN